MEKNKLFKKYGIIISLLIIVLLFFGILNFTPKAFAENNVQAAVDTKSVVANDENLDNLSKKMTNNDLNFDNIDLTHLENIIPIQVLKKLGVYGYIGKEYGFLIEVTLDDTDFYNANIVLLDVKYFLDKVTNTIEYSITPKISISSAHYMSNASQIEGQENVNGSQLYMGNIFLFSELNTVNELNRTDLKYDIHNDNSNYVDIMWANYNNLVKRDDFAELKALGSFAVDLLLAPIEDAVESVCHLPVSALMDFVLNATRTTFECLSDVKYNAPSYQNQVSDGKMQTNAALAIDSNLFLGDCNENSEVKFSIKYDNKNHSNEDFQVGMKVGFDIFRRVNSHFLKISENAEENEILKYDNYNVYNHYKENDNSFDLKCNTIEKINNKIIEKYYANRFWNSNEDLGLTFTALNNRKYDFTTTQGTILNINSINANKGTKYNLKYNLSNEACGKIEIDLKNELQLGKNSVFEGMNYIRLQQNSTDAYMFNINSNSNNALYITDNLGNIVNSVNGTKITSVLQGNKSYTLYIDSISGQNVNITKQLSNESNNNITLNKNEKFYFSYIPPIQNICNIEGDYLDINIYNNFGEVVSNNMLLKDKKYYFEIVGNDSGQVNYKLEYQYVNETLGNSRPLVNEINDIIRFVPEESLVYTFGNANNKFTICTKDGILAQNVYEYYLEKGKEYYFVDMNNVAIFKISYKILNLTPNSNIRLETNVIYKITLPEYCFCDTINNNNIKIYDENRSEVIYNNGYRLHSGNIYIIANVQTEINLSKKIIPVNVILNDGYSGTSKNTTINYGNYYSLEVPVRTGYKFIGWMLNDKLVTNDKGQGLTLWENINTTILQAKWAVKNLYVQLNNNNDVLWVTEDGLNESSYTIPSMDTLNKIVDNLLILVYTDQLTQEGQWKKIELVKETEDSDSYVLQFKVIWTNEKYNVNFILNNGTISTYKVTYSEPFDISSIISYQNGIKADYDVKWECNNTIYTLTDTSMTPFDYTPNNENRVAVDVNYKEIREGKPAIVEVNVIINGKKQIFTSNAIVGEEKSLSEYIPYYQHYEYIVCSGTNATVNTQGNQTNPKIIVNHANGAIIKAELQGKNYNIILVGLNEDYELYGDYKKGGTKEFVATYNTANPIINLPSVMQLRKNHTKWNVMGNEYSSNATITITPDNFGDIEIKPIFADRIILVNNGALINEVSTIANHYDYIVYDLTSATTNVRIIIKEGIEHVRLLNNGSTINDFFFSTYVNDSSIDMVNCVLNGRNYNESEKVNENITNPYVVYTYNVSLVTINLYGENTLTEGKVDDGALALLTGALMTKGATVNAKTTDAKLNLYGTSGTKRYTFGDGIYDGTSGGHGWMGPILNQDKNVKININANVYAYGGNGYSGGNNNSIPPQASKGNIGEVGYRGGHGGIPGAGVYMCCIINITSTYKLYGKSGMPGTGGIGGKGGTGADAVWFGPSAKVGGIGGTGGNGGDGMYGIYCGEKQGNGTLENIVPSFANKGLVYGGVGGTGGDGGLHLTNKRTNSGATGQTGEASKFPTAFMEATHLTSNTILLSKISNIIYNTIL